MVTRSKSSRANIVRQESKYIRCKINSLPIKAMLYAFLYLTSKAEPCMRSASQGALAKANDSVKVLKAVNGRLRGNSELDPSEMYDIINITVSSYVNLYYSIDSTTRSAILDDCHSSLPKELNLLTMPAVMIMKNTPKGRVASDIKRSLCKKPLIFLQSAILASRRMESIRASMSLKKSYDLGSDRLSSCLDLVGKLIENAEQGIVKPKEDEEEKLKVINGLVSLSQKYDTHTLSYIKSKLDETSFNITAAQRVIRQ